MSKIVKVGIGYNQVPLPDGGIYNQGQQILLTDAQYNSIPNLIKQQIVVISSQSEAVLDLNQTTQIVQNSPFGKSINEIVQKLILENYQSILNTTIQEALVSFTPLNVTDVTKISGAPVVIASSTTSVALTLGRQHLVTGSAVQPVTVPTPSVDGTIVSIKVADGATASVTLPASLQVSGVTNMTAGQDFDWFWSSANSTWSIE